MLQLNLDGQFKQCPSSHTHVLIGTRCFCVSRQSVVGVCVCVCQILTPVNNAGAEKMQRQWKRQQQPKNMSQAALKFSNACMQKCG